MKLTHVITSQAFIERTKINVPGAQYLFLEELRQKIGKLELLMMMPTIHSLSESIFPLRCFGAVVRVAPQQGRYGVAVQFEKIDVIAEC